MKKDTVQKFYTKSGEHIATGYTRIVSGERGSFYEFSKEQMVHTSIFIPEDQHYRITIAWKEKIYYYEFRTHQDNVKVYYQRKYVGYADYQPGMYYISTRDVKLNKGTVYNQISLLDFEENIDGEREEDCTDIFYKEKNEKD